jgi:DNA mismatch endonuclease (patch repair protein)
VMAAVRSNGNRSTELRLARILRAKGITGWRRHRRFPGRPDFVFPMERVAVFVDGCLWHGCPLHCRMPKSNTAYWSRKIVRNRLRDREVEALLRKSGWNVCRIWEHALGDPGHVATDLRRSIAHDPRPRPRGRRG